MDAYMEYDVTSDRFYRVVAVDVDRREYKREYAPKNYTPSPEQIAMTAERNRAIRANEEWLSAAFKPYTRRRRLRIVGWALGLRKARTPKARNPRERGCANLLPRQRP